jgi:hypothetical protein
MAPTVQRSRCLTITTVIVAMAALSLLVGCQSQHHSVPTSWRRVDACLERHPAFAGKIRANDKGGPVDRGELLVSVSPRSGAMAYRFQTHRAAVEGVGPRNVVSYYGPVALVDQFSSRRDAAYAKHCFARAYH